MQEPVEKLSRLILFNANRSQLNREFAELIAGFQCYGLSANLTIVCDSVWSRGSYVTTWERSAPPFLDASFLEKISLNMYVTNRRVNEGALQY